MAKNVSKGKTGRGSSSGADVEFTMDLNTKNANRSLRGFEQQIVRTGKKGDQALVSDKLSSRMRGFNERTEKMRQVTAATGVAFGGAAGQAIYYTGTLTAMAGTFGKVELIALGVTAALAIVGSIILSQIRDLEAWRKEMEKGTKALDAIGKQLENNEQRLLSARLGLDQYDAALIKARTELSKMSMVVADANEKLREQQELVKRGDTTFLAKAEEEFAEAKRQYARGLSDLRQFEETVTDIRLQEALNRNEKLLSNFVSAGERQLEADKKKNDQLSKQRSDARQREEEQRFSHMLRQADQDVAEEERRIDSRNTAALKEQENQRAALNQQLEWTRFANDQQMKLDKELAEEKEKNLQTTISIAQTGADTMMQFGDMFDMFGVQAAKTEEERQKAIAKRTVVEGTLQAALEIAKGVAAFYNPPEAAAHFAAATLYLGAVAKAAAYGGGSAGGATAGAGSARGGVSESGFSRPVSTQQQGTTIIINQNGVFGSDAAPLMLAVQDGYRQSQSPSRSNGEF